MSPEDVRHFLVNAAVAGTLALALVVIFALGWAAGREGERARQAARARRSVSVGAVR